MNVDAIAASDPLVRFLLSTPYAWIIGYLLAARAACSELDAWLPPALPTSRFFILRKLISFVAGNYGNAANANTVGLLEGIVVRVLEAKGLTTVPKAALDVAMDKARADLAAERSAAEQSSLIINAGKTAAILLLTLVMASSLSACNSDGTLSAKAQNIVNATVTVSCKLDPAANVLAQGGMTIAAVADPAAAPALMIAKPADALAHQAITQACANVLPGSTPAAVTVQQPGAAAVVIAPPAGSGAQ